MSVFRVEKTKGYTVMSNHHLRNHALSLKAKGLLSQMLSLPDDWDYSLKGLTTGCRDGIDSVRSAVHELEDGGYLCRSKVRDARGRIIDYNYEVFELPQKERIEKRPAPVPNSPSSENPMSGFPTLENPTQQNTNKQNTKKVDTKASVKKENAKKVETKNIVHEEVKVKEIVPKVEEVKEEKVVKEKKSFSLTSKQKDLILILLVVVLLVVALFVTMKKTPKLDIELPITLQGEVGFTEITYSEYEEKMNAKEPFLVVIVRDGCGYCEMYEPIVEEVANEYRLPIYYINMTNLNNDEYTALGTSNSYFKKNQGKWGTPTTLFMYGNSVIDSIPGYVDKDEFVKFVKENFKVDG